MLPPGAVSASPTAAARSIESIRSGGGFAGLWRCGGLFSGPISAGVAAYFFRTKVTFMFTRHSTILPPSHFSVIC